MSPARWLLGEPRWSHVLGKAGQQSWDRRDVNRGAERGSSEWLQASRRWGRSLKKNHWEFVDTAGAVPPSLWVLLHCQDSPHTVAEDGQSFPPRKTQM